MPNKPISMVKIRQVLRCHATGLSSKIIAAHLGISRTTVKKYIHLYQTSGKSFSEILSMDDMELYVLFQEQPRAEKKPVEITPRQAELDSLLPSYSKRLMRRGWTKERLYREYVTTSKDPFARSQFMGLFRNYEIQSNPVVHIDHKAGDKMFVDYAGDKLRCLCDKETGEVIATETFVAILPCSQLTYAEVQISQKKEDFIRGCENALRFY